MLPPPKKILFAYFSKSHKGHKSKIDAFGMFPKHYNKRVNLPSCNHLSLYWGYWMQSIRESKLWSQVVLCTKGRHVKTFNLSLRIRFGCNNIDRCVNWPDGVSGLYWHNMTQCGAGRASDSSGNKMNILPCSAYWPLLSIFFMEI